MERSSGVIGASSSTTVSSISGAASDGVGRTPTPADCVVTRCTAPRGAGSPTGIGAEMISAETGSGVSTFGVWTSATLASSNRCSPSSRASTRWIARSATRTSSSSFPAAFTPSSIMM